MIRLCLKHLHRRKHNLQTIRQIRHHQVHQNQIRQQRQLRNRKQQQSLKRQQNQRRKHKCKKDYY